MSIVAPYHHSSPTSRAAAAAVTPNQRQQVAAFFLARGAAGATREEAAYNLGLRVHSVCGRVDELVRAGVLSPTGRVRPSRARRPAAVLVHTGKAVTAPGRRRTLGMRVAEAIDLIERGQALAALTLLRTTLKGEAR